MNRLQKPRWRNRIGLELLFATAAALAAAVLVYTGASDLGYATLDRITDTDAFRTRTEDAAATRLQEYVNTTGVTLTTLPTLDAWVDKEQDVILSVYSLDGENLYNSIAYYSLITPAIEGAQAAESVVAAETVTFTPLAAVPLETTLIVRYHEIAFADGTARAVIDCFSQYRYYSVVNVVAMGLAFVAFVAVLLPLIRRKTRYIALLEGELKHLEGGDLEHAVTVRGGDELASLAAGIDAMRCAVRDRQQEEETARAANRELIAAMSHDLRTPLTALMGYLDILALDKCTDDSQRAQFLAAGRKKAYQIKELSDKLFEYFLVYSRDADQLDWEQADGAELIGQVVEESIFDLESEGFTVVREMGEVHCRLSLDIPLIRRVFGNLFSNITKYADPAQPVRVCCRQEEGILTITLQNSLRRDAKRTESTGIGLKTCENILLRHGGGFCAGETDGRFTAELTLPCVV